MESLTNIINGRGVTAPHFGRDGTSDTASWVSENFVAGLWDRAPLGQPDGCARAFVGPGGRLAELAGPWSPRKA